MICSSETCVGLHRGTRCYISEDKLLNYIYCHVLGVCDYIRGVDWILDLLTHFFYTRLGTTSNYSAISNLLTSQIRTYTKSSQFAFSSRFLVINLNNRDSSASRAHVVSIRQISRKWNLVTCQLNSSPFWGHIFRYRVMKLFVSLIKHLNFFSVNRNEVLHTASFKKGDKVFWCMKYTADTKEKAYIYTNID
jgi:hypothetical protein